MDYQKPAKKKAEEAKSKDDLKLEKVVVGEVITRKKPLGSRIRDTFLGAEVRTVAQYLGSEILLPALRTLIVDSVSKGTERLIYGDRDMGPRNRPTGYSPTMTYGHSRAYTNYQQRQKTPMVETGYRGSRDKRGFEEMIFPNRKDAMTVLERMQDILDMYDVVSVADMKELAGLKVEFVDNNWGWVYLQDAEIRQLREGYLLSLPSPDQIN